MNNKGFTFIELLITIAVLSLLMAITIPSYTGISNLIRENQRNNKISKIEIAASKYAFDTGETIFFVDKLVTEGYLDSDEDNGDIIDPYNNGNMNCYIVESEQKGEYYTSEFRDGKNYNNNADGEKCDLNKLQKITENVTINVLNNSVLVDDLTKWLKGKIELQALTTNSMVFDCINNRCTWTSSSGENKTGIYNIELENASGLLNTRYTFQYTIYNDGNVQRYTTSVPLKIDNEAPVIFQDQIEVSNKFVNTTSKTIRIKATDGNGSGISGYYLGLYNGNCYDENIASDYKENNVFSVTENGNYLICVKDNVGNFSKYKLKIDYII